MIKTTAIILFFLLVASASADDELLRQLKDDAGWELDSETEAGQTLRTLELPDFDLRAVEVSQVTDLAPETITAVMRDVDAYNDIIRSNRSMECSLLADENGTIYGYQFIKVPLFSDRYLVFEMRSPGMLDTSRIHLDWVLIPEGEHAGMKLPNEHAERDPQVIEHGAGTWLFDPINDSQYRVSYRLYMDPGGWLPDFILNRANRKGVRGLMDDILHEAERRELENTTVSGILP